MKNVKICIVITMFLFFQSLCFGADINLSIKAQIPGSKIGGLALSPDEQKLYAAYWTDSSSEPIGVYSTSSYSLIDMMSYGTCHGGVAVSNDGRYIYTPSYYQGNVSRFDTYNGNSRTALSAGEWSSGIYKSPDGTKLIVYSGKDGSPYDMGNDRIYVYDISNGAFSTIGSIQMPDEPRFNGAFSNDGKYIYVPTYQRQSATARLYEVSIVGTLGINRYLEFPGNGLQGIAGNYNSLFVSDSVNQKIWMIDKATWSITDSIDLSYQPGPVVLHPDGQNLFVVGNGIVSVFDITTKSLKSSLTNIPGSINNIVLTQDGSLAYVSYVSGDIDGGIAIISVSEQAKLQSIKIVGPNSVPEESDTQYKVIGHYDNGSSKNITADANLAVAPDEFAQIEPNGLLATDRLYQIQELCTIRADYKGFSASKLVTIYPVCDGNQCTQMQLAKRDITDVIKIKQDVMDDLKYAMKIERVSSQLLTQIDSDKKCKDFKPGQLNKARIQILAALMWEQWANREIEKSIDFLESGQKILQENPVEKPKCPIK
jgi:6-phosphogluconolactonase (cycloisomerase 2 family)